MGNLRMNADQISYKGGEKPMSVEEAIKNAGNIGLAHTADIAPEFSTESAYNAGDFVYHNGSLYEFTANHAAGAWSTADTQAATVGGKITSLEGDVANLSSVKANQITIAPTFSAETAYDPGDLVYYNGLSYRCVNAHEGEWDADDFAATTISNELATLMSGLTSVDSNLNGIMSIIHTATYGRTETPINIDTLGDDKPYMYLVEESSGFTGSSPVTVLGGGSTFLLIGMGNAPTQPYGWGVQIAFSFTSANIAIRNANYNANAWSAWNIITSSTST